MPCSWSQLSLLMWEVTRVVGNGLVSSCCAHLQEGTGWVVNPSLGLQAVTPAEGRRADLRPVSATCASYLQVILSFLRGMDCIPRAGAKLSLCFLGYLIMLLLALSTSS